MLRFCSPPDANALLVWFSSRTDVLPCLVSLLRCVTTKMPLLNRKQKAETGTWKANQVMGLTPFVCDRLSALSIAAARALSHMRDQHIWTLPIYFSCDAFWYSLSLYPALFTSPLSPGLRERKHVLPLWHEMGHLAGMVSSTDA